MVMGIDDILIGTAIGSSVLSAGAGVINFLTSKPPEMPKIPEVNSGQLSSLSRTQSYADRLLSGGGLTDTEYNRQLQNIQDTANQTNANAVELSRNTPISGLAATRIAKEAARSATALKTKAQGELTSLDIETARRNIGLGLQAQQSAGQQASDIRNQDMRAAEMALIQQEYKDRVKKEKVMGLVNTLTSAANAGVNIAGMAQKKEMQDKILASLTGDTMPKSVATAPEMSVSNQPATSTLPIMEGNISEPSFNIGKLDQSYPDPEAYYSNKQGTIDKGTGFYAKKSFDQLLSENLFFDELNKNAF